MDATAFLDYFTAGNSPDEATIVSLEGRAYPVQIAYLNEPIPDLVQVAAEVVWSIHVQVSCFYAFHTSFAERFQQTPGDILVFLSGREEIDRCLEQLAEMLPT